MTTFCTVTELLERAQAKAAPRRFEMETLTGFDQLSPERRDIAGHEGRYEITSDGRVWSTPRPNTKGGWLALSIDRGGYKVASLFDGIRIRRVRVARAVLAAFVGPPPATSYQANHINGVRGDDRVENLEWVTPVGNTHHAIAAGSLRGLRVARFLTVDGVTKPVCDWPRHPTLSARVVFGRVFSRGWDADRALTTPFGECDHKLKGRPGELNHQAKLTAAQVSEIRESVGRNVDIAAAYGVTPERIGQIKAGRGWGGVAA